MKSARIGLCQLNFSVGDIDSNVERIIENIQLCRGKRVDIVCFPELAVTGYPPEDLLLKTDFIEENLRGLEKIIKSSDGLIAIVGFADRKDAIYNAAAIIYDGKLVDVYHKMHLPNYGVFDEDRYFQSATRIPVYRVGDLIFGVNICEDIWYPADPVRCQAVSGNAEIIINISSSPYSMSKVREREQMLADRAVDYRVKVAYCNLVGGQDELVFDGHSVVIEDNGRVLARARGFKEEILICDLEFSNVNRQAFVDGGSNVGDVKRNEGSIISEIVNITDGHDWNVNKTKINLSVNEFMDPEKEVFNALVLGTRDYVRKNGFERVVVGLSGGIDSALVTCIAVEALGNEDVIAVSMPSEYSSKGSISDAEALSRNLGIQLLSISIHDVYGIYLKTLSPHFFNKDPDVTEENLQARIRGNSLMALSNKHGWLVLTTGNKSELSVGYSTLYGDMAGGFAVIKDIPKMLVYKLAQSYNNYKGREIIPKDILTKPPSAELRPDQKDTDSLPPYEVLDPILEFYVEDDLSVKEISERGFDVELVKRIVRMVDLNEYKRRQSPPGIKITTRAFGKDRRFPITNLYEP